MFRTFTTSLGSVLIAEQANGQNGMTLAVFLPIPEDLIGMANLPYRPGDTLRVEVKPLKEETVEKIGEHLNTESPDLHAVTDLERSSIRGFLKSLDDHKADEFVRSVAEDIRQELQDKAEDDPSESLETRPPQLLH